MLYMKLQRLGCLCLESQDGCVAIYQHLLLVKWHNHWCKNINLCSIITDYLNFTLCQVTKNNSIFHTHFQLFIYFLIAFHLWVERAWIVKKGLEI